MLTTILIGLCIIAIGLYLQGSKRSNRRCNLAEEGFQEMGTAAAAAAVPAAPPSPTVTLPPAVKAEESLNIPEDMELKRKVSEIRRLFKLVAATRPKLNKTLSTLLDADTMTSIDYLYEEVRFFDADAQLPETGIFMNNLSRFNELSESGKGVVRTMVEVGFQEANVLHYIYVTAPAMAVSSKMIVDPNTASADSLTDPAVAEQLVGIIMSSLSSMPKLGDKLEKATAKLMALYKEYSEPNLIDPVYLEKLTNAIKEYYRIVNIRVQSYKATIASKGSGTAVQDMKAFMDSALQVLTPIHQRVMNDLKEMPNMVVLIKVKTELDTAIQTLTLMKASMEISATTAEATMASKEGFASFGNPYNTPGPSTYLDQAMQFRLGHQKMTADILGGAGASWL